MFRIGSAIACLLMVACTFDPNLYDPGTGNAAGDGGAAESDSASGGNPDAAVDVCADAFPFAPLNISRCDIPEPVEASLFVGEGLVIDTRNQTVINFYNDSVAPLTGTVVATDGGPDLFVVAVDELEINFTQTVSAFGTRALVLVSLGDMVIEGRVSVAAGVRSSGAGGEQDCATSTGGIGELTTSKGGGGGGGGGFGTAGGTGAAGSPGDTPTAAAGSERGDATLVPLRGGCRGGAGGGSEPGAGGLAGGAIELVAAGTITLRKNDYQFAETPVITANGGGGRGAGNPETLGIVGNSSGGGGGGSGGAIILEALALSLDGIIVANGGGGGEGVRTQQEGDSGDRGREDSSQAAGGSSGSSGGNGGSGGSVDGTATNGDAPQDGLVEVFAAGGGGGGGAVGRIRLLGHNADLQYGNNTLISPAPVEQ